MKKRLLDFLVCPYCKKRLTLKVFLKENQEIKEGMLVCSCKRVYPIINAISRMLPDTLKNELLVEYKDFFHKYKKHFPRLKKLSGQDKEIKRKTADVWGYQWRFFTDLIKESKQQFLKWIQPVKPPFFKNKLVLDVGCGTGRHIVFSTAFGAETIGIDLSPAVETAYKNTQHIKNAHILQADIYHLPFKDKTFDYIYSIGVIHHLPDPQKGFNTLLNYLKIKGNISVWVYGKENNGFIVYFIEPIRKYVTTKLPLNILNFLSLFPTIVLYIIIKTIYKPLNKIKITKNFVKLLPYNEYFYQFSNFSFKHNWVNVFDKLNAPLAKYYTKNEFKKWFEEAKLKNISITHINNISWSGFGIK